MWKKLWNYSVVWPMRYPHAYAFLVLIAAVIWSMITFPKNYTTATIILFMGFVCGIVVFFIFLFLQMRYITTPDNSEYYEEKEDIIVLLQEINGKLIRKNWCWDADGPVYTIAIPKRRAFQLCTSLETLQEKLAKVICTITIRGGEADDTTLPGGWTVQEVYDTVIKDDYNSIRHWLAYELETVVDDFGLLSASTEKERYEIGQRLKDALNALELKQRLPAIVSIKIHICFSEALQFTI